ncbi:hypothetical protein FXO38_35788 [Capsicum annuum]|nr:hypothetical protein FXO38_35788 [Capsicum annuum]KAF3626858.1 hypothetical protein FXO37_30183 [Capsicum annuum]
MNSMFNDDGKVVFKNIEPTPRELEKFQIPEKFVLEDERSADSDYNFQDLPPKHISEPSKKKQKVDSSSRALKKPLSKKSHNIIDEITLSKKKKVKQTTRVIFSSVQSKLQSPAKKEVVLRPKSLVEEEAITSKKVFYAFRNEQQNADKDPKMQHMGYAGAESSP